jgi:ABC-type transporter Mla subunit MlaD
MTVLAATSWPDAAIAIAGIALVTIIASVLIWQIFATGRRAIGSEAGKDYKKLAEELAAMQRETTAELQKANEALGQLRSQTEELERGLKELDRILKAVE